MTDATMNEAGGAEPKKRGKLPLILGLVLGLAGAGGGYVAMTGLPGSHEGPPDARSEATHTAFVPVPPLTISLGRDGDGVRHLRFQAQLEVDPAGVANVTALLPRVSDVLNGYLRAVAVSDLENPAALIRIRAQMLRRVQIVVGDGWVHDLLVMEFVLN